MLIQLMQDAQPYVDVTSFLLLLLGLGWGIYRGAIQMVFSVLGWFCGLWIAFHCAVWVQHWLSAYVVLPHWLVAIFLFVLVKIAASLLGGVMHRVFVNIGLGFSNRLLGASLGLVQAALVLLSCWYLLSVWDLAVVWQPSYFDQFSRAIFGWLN